MIVTKVKKYFRRKTIPRLCCYRKALSTFAASLLLFNIFFILPLVYADSEGASESDIKAAFIYNFLKFIEWPDSAFKSSEEPIAICIGSGGINIASFAGVPKSQVRGRDIKFISIPEIASSSQLATCHILYTGQSKISDNRNITSLKEKPVLVITESDAGGMIEFAVAENKVRFVVDIAQTRLAGLTVSSQILKIALVVRGAM